MNIKNSDEPYSSSFDAMSYWPEKETAIGVRKLDCGSIRCVSVFELDSLFNLQITHNPKRSKAIFEYRVNSKGWLDEWPDLEVAI